MQIERKNMKRVLFRPDLNLMTIYNEDGKEEAFDYHLCDVEVLKNESTDGLIDGLQLPY